jgi:transcriptional regulator with XRE-family HTH domain
MCKEAGVTQKQALSGMHMGRNAAQRWIYGWPSYETLTKISAYFSVPFETLMQCMESEDENLVRSLFVEGAKKPADQKADGLRDAGYYELTPENQKMIDGLIEKLLKSQSGE